MAADLEHDLRLEFLAVRIEVVLDCVEIKVHGAFVLNHRAPPRHRCTPTHWLIFTQAQGRDCRRHACVSSKGRTMVDSWAS